MDRFDAVADEQLVELSVLGSLEAYDALVRRYRSAVLLVSEQELNCRALAEDASQDAFLMAFRALPGLREPERFPAWLCTIARNRARRLSRANGRYQPAEHDELESALLAHSQEIARHPADQLVHSEFQRLALEALGDLPPDHRTVLWLHYMDEWPVARISEFLSLPSTTVKWRLHRGRELLRRRLTAFEEENDV